MGERYRGHARDSKGNKTLIFKHEGYSIDGGPSRKKSGPLPLGALFFIYGPLGAIAGLLLGIIAGEPGSLADMISGVIFGIILAIPAAAMHRIITKIFCSNTPAPEK